MNTFHWHQSCGLLNYYSVIWEDRAEIQNLSMFLKILSQNPGFIYRRAFILESFVSNEDYSRTFFQDFAYDLLTKQNTSTSTSWHTGREADTWKTAFEKVISNIQKESCFTAQGEALFHDFIIILCIHLGLQSKIWFTKKFYRIHLAAQM